jgi:3-hydroxyisobutyrate dehydrogenase-like beta-hydroxyacid dehydrogenase
MTTTSLQLGFIGLGIMGAPMALHLVNGGHQLHVNTVGKPPESIASSSAKACASAEEVTRNADIICSHPAESLKCMASA